ncbi:hypothetical protein Hanom_Chr15g01346111 [Helianthus anomalus]
MYESMLVFYRNELINTDCFSLPGNFGGTLPPSSSRLALPQQKRCCIDRHRVVLDRLLSPSSASHHGNLHTPSYTLASQFQPHPVSFHTPPYNPYIPGPFHPNPSLSPSAFASPHIRFYTLASHLLHRSFSHT